MNIYLVITNGAPVFATITEALENLFSDGFLVALDIRVLKQKQRKTILIFLYLHFSAIGFD